MQVFNFSSREFNRNVAAAKKAAEGDDIVYILDRGKPAHVLLSIEKFRELSGQKQSILRHSYFNVSADVTWSLTRFLRRFEAGDFTPHVGSGLS